MSLPQLRTDYGMHLALLIFWMLPFWAFFVLIWHGLLAQSETRYTLPPELRASYRAVFQRKFRGVLAEMLYPCLAAAWSTRS